MVSEYTLNRTDKVEIIGVGAQNLTLSTHY